MGAPRPPMEYLAKCSQESLESIELARLARAANLRKEFQQLADEWVAAEVDARFARALLEWRRARASSHVEPVSVLDAREMKQPLPRAAAFQPAAQRQLAFSFAAASSPQLTATRRRLALRASRKKPAPAHSRPTEHRVLQVPAHSDTDGHSLSAAPGPMQPPQHPHARRHAPAPCVLSSLTEHRAAL